MFITASNSKQHRSTRTGTSFPNTALFGLVRVPHVSRAVEEYLHVLTGGMKHLEDASVRQQRIERREVYARCRGVDDRRFVRSRHLDEAEDRPVDRKSTRLNSSH